MNNFFNRIKRYHPRNLSFLPFNIQKYFIIRHEKVKLNKFKVDKNLINYKKLNNIKYKDIQKVLLNKKYNQEWNALLKNVSSKGIAFGKWSANIGDQQIIYYLMRHFKPKSILEVGTHTGDSCSIISSALKENMKEDKGYKCLFNTVDIVDVNSKLINNWTKFGSSLSPIEKLRSLKLEELCNFKCGDSIDFIKSSKINYDFIFLDGDHSADVAYQEIINSFQILNKKSLILLHDFYPYYKIIFNNRIVVPGPYAAFEKIKKSLKNLNFIPFDNLPWTTKNNSNVSSLALVTIEDIDGSQN